ncbi:MAG: UvrD-helicase domain-containing protein [Mariprofundales bacterium]
MSKNSNLSPSQKKAAYSSASASLILAGAGSGKTRTLIHRIAWLIAERGISASRIIAVTFTNKAAFELKERLLELIGDEASLIWTGTFHSVSLRLLRRNAAVLDYDADFQVLGIDERKTVLKNLIKKLNTHITPPQAAWWIEQQKYMGWQPDEAAKNNSNDNEYALLYARYQEELKQLQRMDFGDLIVQGIRLLTDYPQEAKRIRSRFLHVLVDEYQDVNPAQNLWLRGLCADGAEITVVGDDDQSIYGWRGADVQHILNFTEQWHKPNNNAQATNKEKTASYCIEENYRCSGAILSLANAVIAHNKKRHAKKLIAVRENGMLPLHVLCNDDLGEAVHIRNILQQRRHNGIEWQNMAVLYRSNRQSAHLERVLSESAIPYQVIGGVSFFARMEIRDALSYWALLHQCADSIHLLRIANTPKRGIGVRGKEQITEALRGFSGKPAAWLEVVRQTSNAKGIVAKLQPLAIAVHKVRLEFLDDEDQGLMAILQAAGYMTMLDGLGAVEKQTRCEHVKALSDFIEISLQEGLSPIAFLDRVSLLQSGEEKRSQASVSLMSLHRAKGLEFDTVIIAGVEEGLLPHQMSIADSDENKDTIAEECRLLYVGITRAKNFVCLTSTRLRRVWHETIYPDPSRFLSGIGLDTLRNEQTNSMCANKEKVLKAGMRVTHPSFGIGSIVRIEGDGEGMRAGVLFDQRGFKNLILKYAKLSVSSIN